MKPEGTLLLTRSDITSLLRFEEYIQIVEEAFRLYAEGKSMKPELMHVDSVDGEFHIKAGGLELNKRYFALKANGGFFHNRERFGMPNILGAILLCDGENGYPLAIMDSGEITMKRTGAAAAVAAKYLARPESSVMTICGCGIQGRIQFEAMKTILPIRKVFVFDIDKPRAQSFAKEMAEHFKLEVEVADDLKGPAKNSDVFVTCTPSRKYYLTREHVSPGTFIAAMGADSPEKQELEPELLKSNKVVADILEQCAHVGELHHALDKGMTRQQVHAELAEVITGKKTGRTSEKEIIIFDATGTALQDVAAAAAAYEKALKLGKGQQFNFYK